MNNGVALTIFSAFIFSVMNALIKAASLTIPSSEIVFFRSAIGTVLILGLMWKASIRFSTTGIPMLLLRGLFGAFYLLAFVYAITHMPLADAVILAYLSPFFVILLSNLILGEKVPKKVAFLFPLALVGVTLIVNPFSFDTFNLYALSGVASAFFAAAASITIRHLSKRHHIYEIVFYFLFTSMLVSGYLMRDEFVVPQGIAWIYLIAIGLVSLIGQIFLTKAFSHENAAVVAVTRYIGLVFNILWGVIFWYEIPSWMSTCGVIIIITTSISLSLKKKNIIP
ncbi:Pseudopaline exporter CntI [Vibrio crassostreae]|uniref:Permease of the drug/metabolite transporter (DMT) superfamily n=3 Tax=Vibrio TaxID=662 RepID=A0A4R3PHJ6_9VIBR|nr:MULTISPECIES: DMT family transporter [Vibrio]CAH7068550.1 Pseudopaline exporter CntI [Vibrio chagasii]MDH5923993.1 DMT family transporter [Vibrio splendidus]MDH5951649.1 DMT family transporter [Vibrio crassostreae]ROO49579.1 EamA domain-containing membrane protein RarD [Vibrio crassostreae]TCL22126.1 EamA domain-containing membrane protein RarD [Vibrio crassostreae]